MGDLGGLWEFPGGKVEQDDANSRHAAERETMEELGVDLGRAEGVIRRDQQIPRDGWQYYGFICGRGYGKSHAIGCDINERVARGEVMNIGLMATNEDRSDVRRAFSTCEVRKLQMCVRVVVSSCPG